jgi:deoxyribonuclease V
VKISKLHAWNVTPREAFALQKTFAGNISLQNGFDNIEHIAGVDVALDLVNNMAWAAIIVYDFPSLNEVERNHDSAPLVFPYVPGLLSFREAPVILKALARLEHDPDVIFFDGQGIAHPRGMGIASHLGLWLDKPTIGCAKSRLTGTYEEPPNVKGAHTPLNAHHKVIGAVLRTRVNVKPIFVSPGHKIDLNTAVDLTLQCCDGYKIPKPTRQADQYSKELKIPSLFN